MHCLAIKLLGITCFEIKIWIIQAYEKTYILGLVWNISYDLELHTSFQGMMPIIPEYRNVFWRKILHMTSPGLELFDLHQLKAYMLQPMKNRYKYIANVYLCNKSENLNQFRYTTNLCGIPSATDSIHYKTPSYGLRVAHYKPRWTDDRY